MLLASRWDAGWVTSGILLRYFPSGPAKVEKQHLSMSVVGIQALLSSNNMMPAGLRLMLFDDDENY